MFQINKGNYIKVLMLNYEFPPLGGGAGNANYYLLKEFSKYPELKIDLVTTSVSEFRIEKISKNVTVHFIDIGKNSTNFHYQTNKDILIYAFKAYRYARELHVQKCFTLSHAFFGIPCGFIAMKLGLPYIVSLRGSDVPFFNKRFYCLDKLVFKRLSKTIWKKAIKVIANSEGLKELAYKTAPNQEFEVIQNGVDINQFRPLENKVDNEKVRLISTGRLIERKGYAYLLEAIKNMKNVELTLIGDGNLTDKLKEMAVKSNVSADFLGMIEHDKLPDYLIKADIFVLPSLNEGMSNAILEAMACGLPIIATDTGGTRELVKDNGYIVKKGSSIDLKKAINNYMNNIKLIKSHGDKSRHYAENMSWDYIAKNYRKVYSNCIKAIDL